MLDRHRTRPDSSVLPNPSTQPPPLRGIILVLLVPIHSTYIHRFPSPLDRHAPPFDLESCQQTHFSYVLASAITCACDWGRGESTSGEIRYLRKQSIRERQKRREGMNRQNGTATNHRPYQNRQSIANVCAWEEVPEARAREQSSSADA